MSNDVLIQITADGAQIRLNIRAPNLPDAGIQLWRRPLNLPPDTIEQLRSGIMPLPLVRDIASTVSQWLFGAELNLLLSELLGRQDDEPIRLIFSIDEQLREQVADIPLELLWPQGSSGPLVLHPHIAAIVHLLPKVGAPSSVAARRSGPLRVLIVRPNPKDLGGAVPPALPIRDEIFRLLRPDLDPAYIQVDVLSREEGPSVTGLPTREQFLDQLNRSYDILIYLGHGDITPEGGCLLLEMSDGAEPDPMPATVLAVVLHHKPVPVVLLMGCLTATEVPESKRASIPRWIRGGQGVAQALVNSEAGIQLAVGTRYRLERQDAILFLVAWFRSLLRDRPGDVEAAVRAARLALYVLHEPSYSWSSPVVFRTIVAEPLFGFLRGQSVSFIATTTDVANVTAQVAPSSRYTNQPIGSDTTSQQPSTSTTKKPPKVSPTTTGIPIPSPSPWLKTFGFRYDPFAFLEAEQIPQGLSEVLEQTFVDHPGYNERFADRDHSAVLLASHGSGKTASRRRLTDMLTPSRPGSTRVITDSTSEPWLNTLQPGSRERASEPMEARPLVVTYTNFQGVVKPSRQVTLQHHAKPLCAAIAEAVCDVLVENPESFSAQRPLLRQWWWRFLQTFLAGIPLDSRMQHQTLVRDWQGLGDNQPPFQPRTSLQQRMNWTFEQLKSLGINHLFVLIDSIDGEMEHPNQIDMEMLIQPLLNNRAFLSLPGVVYKFFLPDSLKEMVYSSSSYYNHRIALVIVSWDETSLHKLLRLRLQWASEGQSNDIEQWCNQELLESVKVEDEIVRMALRHKQFGPPRALLHLGSLLVKQKAGVQQPSSLLSLSDWTGFLDEAREWCAPL